MSKCFTVLAATNRTLLWIRHGSKASPLLKIVLQTDRTYFMCNRTQINKQPIIRKDTLGVGFLPPTRAKYFLWAKLQQISYKFLRKGRQRTRALYLRHKVTPGTVFGRQCGRLHAGDTRSHSCVSDPASNISSQRGAVPMLPQSILNEQTQVCPMMSAAEKATHPNVTRS